MSKKKLDIAHENYERYHYAYERNHRKYIDKAEECSNFFFSEQWEQADVDRLKKQGRPYLTINKIKPVINDMTGEFLTNRVDVKFIPTSRGDEDTARSLNKLYLHIANDQGLKEKELKLWYDGMITSRAYYDVRVDFDDNLQGEVSISTPNPKNVIPDPDSDSDDPSDWNEVTVVSLMTELEIANEYSPELAKAVRQGAIDYSTHKEDEIAQDSFGGIPFHQVDLADGESDKQNRKMYFVIDRQYRRRTSVNHFVNTETGDTRKIPPHWTSEDIAGVLEEYPEVEVQKKPAMVIRWTVTCGSVVLHDGISPYSTFTIVPWFPVFVRGRASGAVEDMIDPQRNLNKTRSQELHIVNGTANSGWKVKKGSLTNMSTEDLEEEGAKTGVVLEFKDDVKDIERIQPVQIPAGLNNITAKADNDIRSISGIDDESRGVARADVAGKAIQARREASLVSLATYFETLATTRKRLAKKILELVQQFYTEERHYQITRPGLSAQTEQVTVNEVQDDGSIRNDLTMGEYDVVVTSAPARESEDQMQFEELRSMQQDLGINIPAHLFIEYSHLSNKTELVEQIKAINGLGEPSEEEKQLQQMERELEMEEKKASIMARKAQAQLSAARAQKVLSEIQDAEIDDTKYEELMLKARQIEETARHNEASMEIRRRAQEAQEAKMLMDDDLSQRQLEAQRDAQTQAANARGTTDE